MAQRTRLRITITVAPNMLEKVDRYTQEHRGVNWSQVVGEALRLWYANLIHEALVRQHSAEKTFRELEDRAGWKRIRAAQLPRLIRRYELHEDA